ncbi:hypothetical protein KP509_15G073000 [Ceratopteris richardii]|uniref:Uncharacterized protein n=1 Tax=Ceratopteris richardii TaxID=49495 RepID=A0A8T2T8I0_CERRI|nr:hypothetical protein KP509_15G073000 [Ceratopteris richardii]
MDSRNQHHERNGSEWPDENEAVFPCLPQRRRVLMRHQQVLPALRQPLSDITHLVSSVSEFFRVSVIHSVTVSCILGLDVFIISWVFQDLDQMESPSRGTQTIFAESTSPAPRKRLHGTISSGSHSRAKVPRLTLSSLR